MCTALRGRDAFHCVRIKRDVEITPADQSIDWPQRAQRGEAATKSKGVVIAAKKRKERKKIDPVKLSFRVFAPSVPFRG